MNELPQLKQQLLGGTMKYSVLLFDLDQTILDTDTNAERALKNLQLPFEFDFTNERVLHWHHTQQKMWADLELGKLTRQQLVDTRFQTYFDDYDIEVDSLALETQFERTFFAEHELMPHAKDLLRQLHGNYKLAVVSNGTRAKQERILNDARIASLFDEIFLAEDLGYSKPDPRFFEKVSQKLVPYEKSDMLVIGDSLTADIQGAIDSKIDNVWFNPKHLKTIMSPTYEVSDLQDIANILA